MVLIGGLADRSRDEKWTIKDPIYLKNKKKNYTKTKILTDYESKPPDTYM